MNNIVVLHFNFNVRFCSVFTVTNSVADSMSIDNIERVCYGGAHRFDGCTDDNYFGSY